jgi:hypothetical protein
LTACVKQYLSVFSNNGTRIEETIHHLRDFGNKLMIKPNFMILIAKVKSKV